MRVLSQAVSTELTVQKSRFLALLEPISDAEQARSLLKQSKVKFADSSHVVHAFRCGRLGSETMGCSDDGEPSGTAGRPVLDVLKGSGGGNALLLVVRWFGGTKLGTGGLVKAYGEAAKKVIGEAQWQELRSWCRGSIRVEWNEYRLLTLQLGQWEGFIERETFGDGVEVQIRLPAEHRPALEVWTSDWTRGRCQWTFETSEVS